jgi:inositol phosphorylceramide mannosyltransferase catalytic subunit
MVYRLRSIISFIIHGQFIFRKVGNRENSIESAPTKIPKVVFQTTKSNWIPRSFYKDIEEFRKVNPDFKFLTFNEMEMGRFISKHFAGSVLEIAFKSSKFGVMKADIFKYAFAYIYGGISLDLTKYTQKKLSETFDLQNFELVLSQESNSILSESTAKGNLMEFGYPPNYLINWLFACAPKNPLMKQVLDQIEVRYLANRDKKFANVAEGIWETTATRVFTDCFIKNLSEIHSLKIKMVDQMDFGMTTWPKFNSAKYLQVFSKHYTEIMNSKLFNDF